MNGNAARFFNFSSSRTSQRLNYCSKLSFYAFGESEIKWIHSLLRQAGACWYPLKMIFSYRCHTYKWKIEDRSASVAHWNIFFLCLALRFALEKCFFLFQSFGEHIFRSEFWLESRNKQLCIILYIQWSYV